MPYKSILKNLVERTPQAVGAIMVDWEGEAVQEYCHCEPYEIRFSAAHQGIILDHFKALHANSELGGVIEDVVVTASEAHLIIGGIDKDYSLMMSVGRGCPVALALHRFRNTVAELRKEL